MPDKKNPSSIGEIRVVQTEAAPYSSPEKAANTNACLKIIKPDGSIRWSGLQQPWFF